MKILDSLATNHPDLNIVTLLPQQTAITTAVYKARSGYRLPMISDPDGELIKPLNFFHSPTHYILNNSSVVQKVLIGLQDEKSLNEILDITY